jgi:hypothetical protein
MLVKPGGKRHRLIESSVGNTEPEESDGGQVRPYVLQPPWRLLTSLEAVHVDVPESSTRQRRLHRQMRTLPVGTTVVLCSNALGSRWRCRRFARDGGIEVLREYIAIPSAHMPTCYVEDTPKALRYFFSQLLALPKGGAVVSAVFGVAKRAFRVIPYPWLGAVAPARIIVGRVAARPGEGFETRRAATLLDATGMHSVVLALSKDPNAKLTVLLIPHGDSQPALAVKVPATAAAEASIAAERRVLTELHARLSDNVLDTIPAVADLPESRGRTTLVTSALSGAPMTTRYHAWRHLASPAAVSADFATVERWLARFQCAAGGEPTPIDMDGGTAVVLARRFARDAQLGVALRSLDAVYSRLRLSLTPKTAVHGDFWFGNLLLVGDEVSGVVDWEAGSSLGEPTRDLVRFALTYALYLDRHSSAGRHVTGHRGLVAGAWGAGIEYAVDGEGWFPDLFREFLRNGLARLGADPERWRDAALAGLAEVAATADHLDFARLHWQLFTRLSVRGSRVISDAAAV